MLLESRGVERACPAAKAVSVPRASAKITSSKWREALYMSYVYNYVCMYNI